MPHNGDVPGIRLTAVVPPPLADRVLAAAGGLPWTDDVPPTRTPIITLSIDLDDVPAVLRSTLRMAFELGQATCLQVVRIIRTVLDGEIGSPLHTTGARAPEPVTGSRPET
ncbi:hypothetical protein ACFWNN_09540 [Lentzea sp. NPDC058450]|uniref:hypothetical protein n=1 Tax=Lentzea sp. NPDC058450 TaxID=3346505 RepID=UPI0036514521